jgi:hypothetical protein
MDRNYKVDRDAKANEVIERVKKLGLELRVDFESGMNILTTTAPVNAEVIAFMTELANYLPEIRKISKDRAVAALGNNLAGRRICSKEYGAGTLEGGSGYGLVTISIGQEMRNFSDEESRISQRSITSDVESVLILDEVQANAASLQADQASPEKKGIFERLRRG